jgi:cytochrome c oxidase subunit II
MAGQRYAGADVEMFTFVEFRHAWRTHPLAVGCAALLAGCSGELSTLQPAGPAAAHIAELWWVMLGGALLILAGVMGAALYSLRSSRHGFGLNPRRLLIGWGLVFPTLTLLALMAFAFLRGEQLVARQNPQILEIAVRGQQWAWVVEHPGGFPTAGVLHVRAGEPFHVRLTSADVIHSFWIPRLGGKMDAIPGKENLLALQADQPGVYRGVCAEYCGLGHAAMPLEVRAYPPERYADMVLAARTAGDDPVLQPRREPARNALTGMIDHVLRWVGLR